MRDPVGSRQSEDVRGRGEKREAASSLAFFPASRSLAPHLRFILSTICYIRCHPVILTLPQKACYPRSAYFVLKQMWEAGFSPQCGSRALSPGLFLSCENDLGEPFWAEMIAEKKVSGKPPEPSIEGSHVSAIGKATVPHLPPGARVAFCFLPSLPNKLRTNLTGTLWNGSAL